MDAAVGTFRRRRSVFAVLGALVLVMGALGAIVLVTSSGADTTSRTPATSPATAAPAAGFVLTCIAPDEIDDGIDTSSRTDTWVPEGTPVPAGCTRG
jgi:hypothetical protein